MGFGDKDGQAGYAIKTIFSTCHYFRPALKACHRPRWKQKNKITVRRAPTEPRCSSRESRSRNCRSWNIAVIRRMVITLTYWCFL